MTLPQTAGEGDTPSPFPSPSTPKPISPSSPLLLKGIYTSVTITVNTVWFSHSTERYKLSVPQNAIAETILPYLKFNIKNDKMIVTVW